MKKLLGISLALAVAACGPTYSLVPAAPTRVAQNGMHVTPTVSWNKAPSTGLDVKWEENWTQNGPLLDQVTFIGGVPDGQAIAKQRAKDDRKVPTFRSDMSPQDLVSMIEVFHRLRGATVFTAGAVTPVTFIGKPGLQFDYSFVSADEVKRRGRSVVAIVGGKLYMMTLSGTAQHYYNAAIPDFSAMTASATVG